MSRCPEMISADHHIEWMEVPSSTHFGDFETIETPGYKRGICMNCGEQFTDI